MADQASPQQPGDTTPSPASFQPATSARDPGAAEPLEAMLAASGSFADPTGLEAAATPEPLPDQASIEEMLRQATFEEPTGVGPDAAAHAHAAPIAADPFQLPNFSQVIQDAQVSSIDLLRDVELNVKIELGRSRMLVEDVLRLGEGSVVELDKLAGDPVDVFVNERLVARGEVLVLNDNFCVRVNEIVPAAKDEGL